MKLIPSGFYQYSKPFSSPRFGRIAESGDINSNLEKSGYKTTADILRAAKDNYLDSGNHYAIFTIPNNKTYLLGIPRKTDLWEKLKQNSADELLKGKIFKNFNLFPAFQMGQAIAKLGDLEIRKRIPGYPHGVKQSKLNAPFPDESHYRAYEAKAYKSYTKKILAIHKFPQIAYTNLALFLSNLESSNPRVFFDPIANNIMVDADNKHFRVIDPFSEKDARKHLYDGNNLASMVAALFDNQWLQRQKKQYAGAVPIAAKDAHLTMLRKDILKKCIIAAHTADLSPQRNPFPEASLLHKSHDLRYSFKSAGLSKQDCHNVITNFHTNNFETTLNQVFSKAKA